MPPGSEDGEDGGVGEGPQWEMGSLPIGNKQSQVVIQPTQVDEATGTRIRDAELTARHEGRRCRRWERATDLPCEPLCGSSLVWQRRVSIRRF
jgi:hypothetical protein